jgi:hypothetical protein
LRENVIIDVFDAVNPRSGQGKLFRSRLVKRSGTSFDIAMFELRIPMQRLEQTIETR